MIGVDEVGRGCLAGPLLVVAARYTGRPFPRGLKDSKLLTRSQRQMIFKKLQTRCHFSEGWASSAEIDSQGLSAALKLAGGRALDALGAATDEPIILDGPFNYLPNQYTNVECVIKADSKLKIVSAASVYAKVTRDNYMISLHDSYPDYGFDRHVGYGTHEHRRILAELGALSNIHRLSWRPFDLVKLHEDYTSG